MSLPDVAAFPAAQRRFRWAVRLSWILKIGGIALFFVLLKLWGVIG